MKKFAAFLLAISLLLMGSAAFAYTDGYVTAEDVSTRSGPGTDYSEPGTFLRTGSKVFVHTKVWDSVNEIYWVQIEFTSGNQRYRAYTGDWRLDVDLNRVPYETVIDYGSRMSYATCGYAGPGYDYHYYGNIQIYKNAWVQIIEVENEFALIDTTGSSAGHVRAWVPLSLIQNGYRYAGQDTFMSFVPYYGWDDDQGATLLPEWNDDQGATLLPGYDNNDWLYDEDYPIGRTCEVWVDSGHARSGAGVGYDHVAYINKGDVLTILDRKMSSTGKDWYRVRIDGRLCWVSSGLVTVDGNSEGTAYGVPIEPADELAEYPIASKYLVGRWIRVDASSAHVRKEPNTTSKTVGYVKQYQYYEILECRIGSTGKEWYKIEVENETGWISSGLVTLVN